MNFKRNIVGQPLRSSRRHEHVSFAVGFALVAGAALATSWSLLWTSPAPQEPQATLAGPTHVEAIEARAGSVPELDESVAVYLPREGAVLGLPLEPTEPPPSDEAGEIVPEGQDTSQMWLGLPAFAEAAATALDLGMAGDQIWAPVGAVARAGRPGRDIWPWVWVPTLVAMPFLLTHESGGSSHHSAGVGAGSGQSSGEGTPGVPPGAAPGLPAPTSTDGSTPTPGGASAGGSDGLTLPDVDAPAASFADFGAPGDAGDAADLRGETVADAGSSNGAAPVPEPTSILLFAAGLAALALALRRAR